MHVRSTPVIMIVGEAVTALLATQTMNVAPLCQARMLRVREAASPVDG